MNQDPSGVTPVRRQGLSEQVAQQLLGLIRSGNLRPGDRLPPERELAQQMGVSRPVLREALRALATFGLVHTQHGGGSCVTAVQPEALIGPISLCLALSDQDLPHILEARSAIEMALIRNVTRVATPQLIQVLRDNIARQYAVIDDVELCSALTDEFRRLIIDACDNPFLTALAKSMELVAQRARLLYLTDSGRVRDYLAREERLLDAVAVGDADGAVAAHEDHLQRLAQEVRRA